MAEVPTLPPRCGSWIVRRRDTGEAVLETFSRSVAEKVDGSRFEVLTALDHLQQFNAGLRLQQEA